MASLDQFGGEWRRVYNGPIDPDAIKRNRIIRTRRSPPERSGEKFSVNFVEPAPLKAVLVLIEFTSEPIRLDHGYWIKLTSGQKKIEIRF
ncbi:hypothetical protein [Arthrobacter sp. BF1]|uniref:hypothetical protein n=1 Tax=Arthrobacter sp. BF1 TaxID=2821145 RepID=UPI001C4F9AF6|nr:hypothetical protein [Arthrobacter sp. BF1]